MKYLQKSFSVPISAKMTDEEWAEIWAPKCPRCGAVYVDHPQHPGACSKCGAYQCCVEEEPCAT
jgi:ribosomal protein S27AE